MVPLRNYNQASHKNYFTWPHLLNVVFLTKESIVIDLFEMLAI